MPEKAERRSEISARKAKSGARIKTQGSTDPDIVVRSHDKVTMIELKEKEIINYYNQFYRSAWTKLSTIRKGLEASAITDLILITGVKQVDLAHILSLTEPTLRKYIREGKDLNQNLSEHIIQLFELFDKGMDTFGSLEEFKNWLPHYNIGINAKPIDLLDSITGINMVMNELLRIDHGVVA